MGMSEGGDALRSKGVIQDTELIRPALVAHRGYWLRYPENTLVALLAAVEAGAECVEFDVQMTADNVPVLLHDADLQRTASVAARVMELSISELRQIEVNEPARLGPAFRGVRLPTVAEAVALLGEWPQVVVFVETKQDSLRRFGTALVVERVVEMLRPVLARCVVISYDSEALERARDGHGVTIGWIIKRWRQRSRRRAELLAPGYLVCKHLIAPRTPGGLWPGPWRWVLYDADTPEAALRLARLGAAYVETRAIGELLSDPRLNPGGPPRP